MADDARALNSNEWQALVVGGSGMLHGTCVALAKAGWTVAIVSRDKKRLDQLVAETQDARGKVIPLPCDYEDLPEYTRCLTAHVDGVAPIRLVVSWIHGGAEHALRQTIDVVSRKPAEQRTLLELATGGAEATTHATQAPLSLTPEWTRRHATIGFRLEHDGHLRWLTDREIAEGVTEALRSGLPDATLGNVPPWSI